MNQNQPPKQLESLLLCLLRQRDRDSIAGDLLEEYRSSQVPRRGKSLANIWYARQVFSLAWRRLVPPVIVMRLNTLLTVFTFSATTWLLIMEFVLKHDGYLGRVGLDGYIACQSIATLAWLLRGNNPLLRWLSLTGVMALFTIGFRAIVHLHASAHFEGYAAIIALALLLQSVATAGALAVRRTRLE